MTVLVTPLLLALADDDFILGYRDSEWTGIAPMLEEDVAMSSISLDEIGHARVLYELAVEMSRQDGTGDWTLDRLAYGRAFDEYRSCWLVERDRRDWAFTIARRYLYETADEIRTASLLDSAFTPLAAVMAKIRREERYHTMHVETWLERLASSDEARPRFLQALEELWSDALGFWEELEGEDRMLAGGVMTIPSAELRERWLEKITHTLAVQGIRPPGPDVQPHMGGRHGRRCQEFEALWTEMTEVYRLDPQATW